MSWLKICSVHTRNLDQVFSVRFLVKLDLWHFRPLGIYPQLGIFFVIIVIPSVVCAVGPSVNLLQIRVNSTYEHCFARYTVSMFLRVQYEKKSYLN
jgi:hypothetical protein